MEFDFKRVVALIQRYWIENTIGLLKGIFIIFVIFVILKIPALIGNNMISFGGMVNNLYNVFMIYGVIISTLIFTEIHQPGKSFRFLTLPASNLEKFLSVWIITVPIFLTVVFIEINLIAYTVSGIGSLFGKETEVLDIISNHGFGDFCLHYLLIQPIFLLGGIYFKKNQIINTILTVLIVFIALALVITIYSSIIFRSIELNEAFRLLNFGSVKEFFSSFLVLKGFNPFYVISPVCLIIAYFRLTEAEV